MHPTAKLLLGTVQLGLNYGVNNSSGIPSQKEALDILDYARSIGIECLDTAEAYGKAHTIIGAYNQAAVPFKVITKLNAAHHGAEEKLSLPQHVDRVLAELNVPALEGYLFHSFSHYRSFQDWDILLKLKKGGYIIQLGVSVYTNEQALVAAEDARIGIVQLPYNLLDNNALKGEVLKMLKQHGKEVHTRSVFLQGLFFMREQQMPPILKPLVKYLAAISGIAAEAGISLGDLALGYALCNPLIDKILVGVESKAQLEQNSASIDRLSSIDTSVFRSVDEIVVHEAELLNPTNWS